MSLVAYATSDGEESSDAEEVVDIPVKEQNLKDLPNSKTREEDFNEIPIEDDEYDVIPTQNSGLSLPAPKYTSEVTQTVHQPKSQASILSALPAPRNPTEPGSFNDEEDELEEEVKPKAKQLADVPLPPSKHKKKQIMIPSLDDYDSDEDKPKKKRPKGTQGSGLFSVLPPPKNATSKEVGRMLLPHSLSKPKPAATSKNPAAKRPMSNTSRPSTFFASNSANISGKDDSDDDGEEVSFFALGQEDKIVPMANPLANIDPVKGNIHEPSLRGPWLGPAAPASDLLGPALKQTVPSRMELSGGSNSSAEPVAGSSDAAEEPMYTTQPSADFGQNFYPEVGEVQSFLQDEEFLKLQGKKGRREEAVNIIDVRGDDQISQVDLMKHMTEEKEMRSFGKKGKDMPSSQQRRKHQITYLAHQAKERELELKNAWAQNRQTRRQTQSKYGF